MISLTSWAESWRLEKSSMKWKEPLAFFLCKVPTWPWNLQQRQKEVKLLKLTPVSTFFPLLITDRAPLLVLATIQVQNNLVMTLFGTKLIADPSSKKRKVKTSLPSESWKRTETISIRQWETFQNWWRILLELMSELIE